PGGRAVCDTESVRSCKRFGAEPHMVCPGLPVTANCQTSPSGFPSEKASVPAGGREAAAHVSTVARRRVRRRCVKSKGPGRKTTLGGRPLAAAKIGARGYAARPDQV